MYKKKKTSSSPLNENDNRSKFQDDIWDAVPTISFSFNSQTNDSYIMSPLGNKVSPEFAARWDLITGKRWKNLFQTNNAYKEIHSYSSTCTDSEGGTPKGTGNQFIILSDNELSESHTTDTSLTDGFINENDPFMKKRISPDQKFTYKKRSSPIVKITDKIENNVSKKVAESYNTENISKSIIQTFVNDDRDTILTTKVSTENEKKVTFMKKLSHSTSRQSDRSSLISNSKYSRKTSFDFANIHSFKKKIFSRSSETGNVVKPNVKRLKRSPQLISGKFENDKIYKKDGYNKINISPEYSPVPKKSPKKTINVSIVLSENEDILSTKLDDCHSKSARPIVIIEPENWNTLEESNPEIKYKPYNALFAERVSSYNAGVLKMRNNVVQKHAEDGSAMINNYRLERELGKGGYGVVHLVYSDEDKSSYAMKIMSKRKLMKAAGYFSVPYKDNITNPRRQSVRICRRTVCRKSSFVDPLDKLYQEINILKELHHPHVVKLFEVIEDRTMDNLYMVFEHVTNGDVMDVDYDDPFPEQQARCYFRDIILGLEYIHSHKIVHRDIKPCNLLLSGAGYVKIADFGCSVMFDGEDATLSDTVGSPAFMAPETLGDDSEFKGKPLDIWALGITLFSFLYGKVPFSAHSKFDLYHEILTEPVRYPLTPKISIEALDLLMRLLEKNPSKRTTIRKIRKHPWTTDRGNMILPTKENNTKDLVKFEVVYSDLNRNSNKTKALPKGMLKTSSSKASLVLGPKTSSDEHIVSNGQFAVAMRQQLSNIHSRASALSSKTSSLLQNYRKERIAHVNWFSQFCSSHSARSSRNIDTIRSVAENTYSFKNNSPELVETQP